MVNCEENKGKMKHLFLEGPIRSGKSTLIKSCLKEFSGTLGGFSCKRYRDGSGDIRAFGLTGPDDFDVDGLYDPAACGDPENGVPAADPGIFLVRTGSGAKIDNDAFIRMGISYLDDSADADLILLDEIGGVELMSDEFRENLYEVLSGDTPCIGVLKQMSHAQTMEQRAGKDSRITEINEALRNDITGKFGGTILSFERARAVVLRKEIMQFLDDIL